MADGSHGWSPNCADLPVAAIMRPSRGKVRSRFLAEAKICCISQEFRFTAIHAIARMRPISPSRL